MGNDLIMSEEEIKNIDWDKMTDDISHEESVMAMFDIVTEHVSGVIDEWMNTTVYARPPEGPDDLFECSDQPFDGSQKINLGHIAALPILNIIAQILGEAGVDPEDIAPAIIQSRKDLFLGMVGAMMVEGIMIAHAPAWRDKMDAAVKGVREIPDEWFGPNFGLNV
jgi:hypothetical protein